MSMRWLGLLIIASMSGSAYGEIHRTALPGSAVIEVRIDDPRAYWRDAGFELMSPAIRVSVAAHTGSQTRIYLKIGAGARLATEPRSNATFSYPPGSESDRVSLVRYRDGGTIGYTIDDVRGTRWDAAGREYFHVYRASGAAPHAPLVGFEWPRDDSSAASEATERLAGLVRDTALPNGYRSSRRDVRRFRRLNRCESCHWAGKANASHVADRGPPWATDASGLFTPLAVLLDRAPLSAEASFHDPNADDPYVTAECPGGPAARHGRAGGYFFSCPAGAYPIGVRDIARAVRAGDPYSLDVCRARQYLFDRMEPAGQRHFRPAMAACGA